MQRAKAVMGPAVTGLATGATGHRRSKKRALFRQERFYCRRGRPAEQLDTNSQPDVGVVVDLEAWPADWGAPRRGEGRGDGDGRKRDARGTREGGRVD